MSGVTGIAADVVREVAREWAARGARRSRCRPASTWAGRARSRTGSSTCSRSSTGNLDRRGGNIESVGYYPTAAKAGRTDPARTFFDARFGRMRHVRGSLPGNLLADEILTPGPGQVRALFVIAGNPLLSMADEPRLRRRSLRSICSSDRPLPQRRPASSHTISCRRPISSSAPTSPTPASACRRRPHVQYTPRVVAPQGERREEWWILARLCKELGFKGPLDEGDEPTSSLAWSACSSAAASRSRAQAAAGGVMLLAAHPGRFFADRSAPTTQVDCCPPSSPTPSRAAAGQFDELEHEGPGPPAPHHQARPLHAQLVVSQHRQAEAPRAGAELSLHASRRRRGSASRDGGVVRVRSPPARSSCR